LKDKSQPTFPDDQLNKVLKIAFNITPANSIEFLNEFQDYIKAFDEFKLV